MKKIKVNNLEKILVEVKKYADAKKILTENVYRLNQGHSYKKDERTGKEVEKGPYEGIGVRINDEVDIYIKEEKTSEQTKKFDQLYEELKKEISKIKIIWRLDNETKKWPEIDSAKEWNYWDYSETNNWQTFKDNLREFYYRHKKSIDQKKDFNKCKLSSIGWKWE